MRKIGGPQTTVILEQETLDKLDAIGRRFKIPRAEAHRRILETGLEVYSLYEGLGVVKLAELAKRAKETCARGVQPSLF
jgi:hypothetical protein